MNKIFEVREKLNSALTEYRSLVSKEADLPVDESLPDDDTSRLATLEKEIAVLQHRVSRLETADALPDTTEPDADDTEEKALTASSVMSKQFAPAHRAPATVAEPLGKGLRAARFLIGKAYADKNGTRAAADMMSKNFHDDMVAKAIMSVTSTGATTIPTFFSTDLIELLRPLVAVRDSGAAVIDTSGGNLTIPRLAQAASAQWQTENADILSSNETIDTVTLSNHKLTAMVAVSNDLIRRAVIGMDQLVRDDLLAVISRAEDVGFLTSTGAGGSPVGLKAQVGIQSFTAGGTDLASVTAGINGAVIKLQMANTRMLRPGWIMSPMAVGFLANQRDGVGGFFTFASELAEGKLRGYPVVTTTNLPINLTNYLTASTGVAGSDIFLADFADVLIGDTMAIDLETSNTASYFDGTTLQSAFSKDLTLFRVIKETDLVLRHASSVVQLKTDAWKLY